MEPDFSGWATKAGLKCSDGRTIMPDAFKHQDKVQVPLVWSHQHTDPENILGHAILTNKDEGVWADCFFNGTVKAAHAKEAVGHKDINAMSIWANQLVERSKRVFHGAIREVSLVLSGANPGALIQNVTIHHSDDEEITLEDEVIIFTGEELVHSSTGTKTKSGGSGEGDESVQDIYDAFTEKQKNTVAWMIGQALDSAGSGGTAGHGDLDLGDDDKYKATYESMNEDQKNLLHSMIDEALSKSKTNDGTIDTTTTTDDKSKTAEHGNLDPNKKGDDVGQGQELKHNIFEKKDEGTKAERIILSHSDIESIVSDAKTLGSMKKAVEAYASAHLEHGINDIDVLFPDAKALTNTPDFISRRTEWVNKLMTGIRKSPFSRIKTVMADITVQEARAKGYIKGTLKKEEFFGVAKRTTGPTTVYKKQKLDRDDIVDITDFDVVVWLKAEMRVMLDEEVARAILLGDGRPVDDPDKIAEDCIRPIATDHEVYVTTITIPIDDTPATIGAAIDEIALRRSELRGTGSPTFWTTERYIARMLLLKDNTGRKLYRNIDELASDMRVSEIVPVEVMEEYPEIFGILVNPTDYVSGTDQGGQVTMFDDFDIDYNQQKYLIETRLSGALVKFKCAMVVRTVVAAAVAVMPADPVFDGEAVTITDTPNVVYRNQDTDVVMTAAGSPYAVAPDTTIRIVAEPAAGHYVEDDTDAYWAFTNNA